LYDTFWQVALVPFPFLAVSSETLKLRLRVLTHRTCGSKTF